MDWQAWVSLSIVASAAVLLVRGRLRHRKFSFQRSTHCGCAAVHFTAPQGSIVFRASKGKRPEVLLKMN
jgi:hypothetical protein